MNLPTTTDPLAAQSHFLRREWIDFTLDIDASPEAVFALMSDIDGWSTWVPGLSAIWRNKQKPVAVGTPFAMMLVFPVLQRMVLPCQVYVWRPDYLEWGAGLTWSGVRHSFRLTRLPDGRTRLHHVEYATGLLAVLLRPFEGFALNHDRNWSLAIQAHFARG